MAFEKAQICQDVTARSSFILRVEGNQIPHTVFIVCSTFNRENVWLLILGIKNCPPSPKKKSHKYIFICNIHCRCQA